MSWPPCLLLLLYCFPGFMSIDAVKQEFGTVQDLPASPSVLHSVIASQFRKGIPRRQIATLSPASPSIIYSIPVVRMSRNSSALTTRPSSLGPPRLPSCVPSLRRRNSLRQPYPNCTSLQAKERPLKAASLLCFQFSAFDSVMWCSVTGISLSSLTHTKVGATHFRINFRSDAAAFGPVQKLCQCPRRIWGRGELCVPLDSGLDADLLLYALTALPIRTPTSHFRISA